MQVLKARLYDMERSRMDNERSADRAAQVASYPRLTARGREELARGDRRDAPGVLGVAAVKERGGGGGPLGALNIGGGGGGGGGGDGRRAPAAAQAPADGMMIVGGDEAHRGAIAPRAVERK